MHEQNLVGSTSAEAPEIDLPPGYAYLATIGKGGNGLIVKAIQVATDRKVAIKFLRESHTFEDRSGERLKREVRIMAGFDHPNILKILGFGLESGAAPFIISEYLDGQSLAQLLKSEGALCAERCVSIMRQVLSGMIYAHSSGITHRDLKPANIIIIRDSNDCELAKILDFGIALDELEDSTVDQKLTRPGSLIGSPGYMSPEQCAGGKVGPLSDLYSLGCIIFECLTGAPPFVAETPVEVMFKHMNERPRVLNETDGIPQFVGKLVDQCLQKDPALRPASAAKLLEALSGHDDTLSRYVIAGKKLGVTHGKKLLLCAVFSLVLLTAAGYCIRKQAPQEGVLLSSASKTRMLSPRSPRTTLKTACAIVDAVLSESTLIDILNKSPEDERAKLMKETEKAETLIDELLKREIHRKAPDLLMCEIYLVKCRVSHAQFDLGRRDYGMKQQIKFANKVVEYATEKDGSQHPPAAYGNRLIGEVYSSVGIMDKAQYYFDLARKIYDKPKQNGFIIDRTLDVADSPDANLYTDVLCACCDAHLGHRAKARRLLAKTIPRWKAERHEITESCLAGCGPLLDIYACDNDSKSANELISFLNDSVADGSASKLRVYEILMRYNARSGRLDEALSCARRYMAEIPHEPIGSKHQEFYHCVRIMHQAAKLRGNKKMVEECQQMQERIRQADSLHNIKV